MLSSQLVETLSKCLPIVDMRGENNQNTLKKTKQVKWLELELNLNGVLFINSMQPIIPDTANCCFWQEGSRDLDAHAMGHGQTIYFLSSMLKSIRSAEQCEEQGRRIGKGKRPIKTRPVVEKPSCQASVST